MGTVQQRSPPRAARLEGEQSPIPAAAGGISTNLTSTVQSSQSMLHTKQ